MRHELLLFLAWRVLPVAENAGIFRPNTMALGTDRSANYEIRGTICLIYRMKYASHSNIAALMWIRHPVV